MKYTVILTEGTDGGIHVAVPGLPDCVVEAKTREEALAVVRETIAAIMRRSEILQLDVSVEPKSGSLQGATPWEWFGAFKGEPTWGESFDEIERQRNGDER
jgi:predicted RNase H-like HicB family nuclease